MNSNGGNQTFEFGDFRMDGKSRTIFCRGESVPLTAKVFDTLLYLVSNHDRIVDKNELMRQLWPDTIVEENNLNKNISKLRQVLGEKPGEHRFIATVPGKGYKFVAPVVTVSTSEMVESPLQNAPQLEDETGQRHRSGDRRNRWILPAIISGIVLLIAGVGVYFLSSREQVSTQNVPTKLAILPFKPLTIENRDEALELGMADTLISRLGGDGGLVVTPLSSVRRFGGIEQDPHEAGRQLGVDRVLDGSIQRSENNVRVNVRLIDVSNGLTVWNGTYDEEFTNIFSVQDRITARLVEAFKLGLNAANQADQHSRNPDAYRLYLQGRYYSHKVTPAEVRRGIGFFQQAIDIDPTYARAYAGIADAYRTLPINGDIPSPDVMPLAKAAAGKALEIDPEIADAQIVLGWVSFWYEHDWAAAETYFTRAIDLSPNNPDAYRGYSVLLTCIGRHEEAIAAMAKARSLDPLSLITGALEGQTYLFAGQLPKAIESLNKTFEVDPNFWVAHIQLARILIQQNELDRAVEAAEKAATYSGGNSEAVSLAGYAYAKAGQSEKAHDSLKRLNELKAKGLTTEYNTAIVLNGLGQNEAALSHLEQAFAARDVRLIILKIDPRWDNLRADPRFVQLMRQMNFE